MNHSTDAKKPAPGGSAEESMANLMARLDKLHDEAVARRLEEMPYPAERWRPTTDASTIERTRERFRATGELLAEVIGGPPPSKQASAPGREPAVAATTLKRLVAEFCAPVVRLLRENMQGGNPAFGLNVRGAAAARRGGAGRSGSAARAEPDAAPQAARPLDLVCWEPERRLLYLEWALDVDTALLAAGDRVDASIETPEGRRAVAARYERRHGGAPDPSAVTIDLDDEDLAAVARGEVDVKWLCGDVGQSDRLEVVFRVSA